MSLGAKLRTSLSQRVSVTIQRLHHANKVTKTNADKAQLFAESVQRHFGIESNHFDSKSAGTKHRSPRSHRSD